MSRTLPPKLNDILRQDASLYGEVLQNFETLEPWLAEGGMPFFPEYTDHGPKHIDAVLESAAELISVQAFRVVSPGDIAVLATATLLHDAALHLQEDGFIGLLSSEDPRLPNLDDKSWSAVWQDFLLEARRFDGKALKRLFGTSEPIRTPPLDPQKMTARDRLLIGEFIRRHHPRLAHEIALFGVPGPADIEPLKVSITSDEMLDLSGFVARSHGIPLRNCLEYLDKYFHLRDYRGIHAVFIMTILRIADYIQIQSDRAPTQMRKVRTIRSPISRREWNVHDSVHNITFGDTDPEAVLIQARPRDLATYLRLDDWLTGLQSELDVCWAVLGEVYGRYSNENLHFLGLSLRRIKSDMSRIASGNSAVDFLPIRTSFDAAGTDLIKLLVRPLYGNHPEIAVRELIQNAVDAVLELQFIFASHPHLTVAMSNSEQDINVSLETCEDGAINLTVVDTGIGMTAETVANYFLRAGASSRNTDTWLRTYGDEAGHSQVLRSGRFGIGALAAFLLGNSIEVVTRNVWADKKDAVTFKATLDDDIVELRRTEAPVGTTIKIRLEGAVASFLADNPKAWDWYTLSSPSPVVNRIVNGQKLLQEYEVPSLRAESDGWHRIHANGFDDVQWSYSQGPSLICNGIAVRLPTAVQSSTTILYSSDAGVALKWPRLSIFDSDGNLPLNLQRTSLVSDLPFKECLLKSVIGDLIQDCVKQAPKNSITSKDGKVRYWSLNYVGIDHTSAPEIAPWFYTPSGVGLFDPAIIATLNPRVVLVVNEDGLDMLSDIQITVPVFLLASPLLDRHRAFRRFPGLSQLRPLGMRVLTNSETSSSEIHIHEGGNEQWQQRRRVDAVNSEHIVVRFGECGAPTVPFESLAKAGSRLLRFPLIAELYLNTVSPASVSPLAAQWRKSIPQGVIPFDLTFRTGTT